MMPSLKRAICGASAGLNSFGSRESRARFSSDTRAASHYRHGPVKNSRASLERYRPALLTAVLALALISCRTRAPKETAAAAPPPTAAGTNQTSLLVAPTASGKVASVNQQGRFVVLSFPIGQVPAANTRMVVYRGDAKTGEVKITGPTQDNLTVADIVMGSVQENDEVRDH